MQLKSKAFEDGGMIPVKFTCEGPNVSPPLEFIDVPAEAKSLVLMIEDPDAEAKPWVHWMVFNIPPDAKAFEENSIAPGAEQGLCNGNTLGYEGPCPPENEHTYVFKLYAVDKMLDTDPTPDRKKVLQQIHGHTIDEVVLEGRYQKGEK
jgi:Raf kinase inhibitor-like YbhB/YbcL family protein